MDVAPLLTLAGRPTVVVPPAEYPASTPTGRTLVVAAESRTLVVPAQEAARC